MALHVDAINRAIADIPPDRIRLHVCWGNYDGPHIHDVPLEAILPLLYQARVGALSSNSPIRAISTSIKSSSVIPCPTHMLFMPGVIDSTTNYVEHPEVVADRICQAVEAVGRPQPRDCLHRLWLWHLRGLRNGGGECGVGEARALSDGAALATRRLFT